MGGALLRHKLVCLLFIVIYSEHAFASLLCPFSKLPSDIMMRTAHVFFKNASVKSVYRISISQLDGFEELRAEMMLAGTLGSPQCPARCFFELATNEATNGYGSILHQHNIISNMPPHGYRIVQSADQLICVPVAGDCAANTPIFRYYRVSQYGIHHAYSFSHEVKIEDYILEDQPLCYGWSFPMHTTTTIGTPEGILRNDSCSETMSASSLAVLNIYENKRPASYHDHYYTTRNSLSVDPDHGSRDLYGYVLKGHLARVAITNKDCDCLIEMIQMVDTQDGAFARIDHKFMPEGKEKDRPEEHYVNLDERFFCATEMNACGATLPLRKFFHLADIDSLYTVNETTAPVGSVPYPEEVICYVWELDPTAENATEIPESSFPEDAFNESFCGLLMNVSNGVIVYNPEPRDGSVALHTIAEMSCLKGTAESQNTKLVCLGNNNWFPSNRFPDCRPTSVGAGCPPLAVVSGGIIVYNRNKTAASDYSPDTVAFLLCEEGFLSQLDTRLICRRNGEWFPVPEFAPCQQPKNTDFGGNGSMSTNGSCDCYARVEGTLTNNNSSVICEAGKLPTKTKEATAKKEKSTEKSTTSNPSTIEATINPDDQILETEDGHVSDTTPASHRTQSPTTVPKNETATTVGEATAATADHSETSTGHGELTTEVATTDVESSSTEKSPTTSDFRSTTVPIPTTLNAITFATKKPTTKKAVSKSASLFKDGIHISAIPTVAFFPRGNDEKKATLQKYASLGSAKKEAVEGAAATDSRPLSIAENIVNFRSEAPFKSQGELEIFKDTLDPAEDSRALNYEKIIKRAKAKALRQKERKQKRRHKFEYRPLLGELSVQMSEPSPPEPIFERNLQLHPNGGSRRQVIQGMRYLRERTSESSESSSADDSRSEALQWL